MRIQRKDRIIMRLPRGVESITREGVTITRTPSLAARAVKLMRAKKARRAEED